MSSMKFLLDENIPKVRALDVFIFAFFKLVKPVSYIPADIDAWKLRC